MDKESKLYVQVNLMLQERSRVVTSVYKFAVEITTGGKKEFLTEVQMCSKKMAFRCTTLARCPLWDIFLAFVFNGLVVYEIGHGVIRL